MEPLKNFILSLGFSEVDIKKCIDKVRKSESVSEKEILRAFSVCMEHNITVVLNRLKVKGITLKDYQLRAARFISFNRGAIFAFDVGTGKTITSLASSLVAKKQAAMFGKKMKVIIVCPVAIKREFAKEMNKLGIVPKYDDWLTFSYEGFNKKIKEDKNFAKGKIIIFDEAHTLRTDYRGSSGFGIKKDGTLAENVIKSVAKAWRVILLSATPGFNSAFDIVNLAAMVKGIKTPLTFSAFNNLIDGPDLEDYFKCMFFFQGSNEEEFPRRVYKDEESLLRMSEKFYAEYMKKERGNEDEKGDAFLIKMRQATNTITPNPKIEKALEIIREGDKTVIYSFFLDSGINIIKERLKNESIPFIEVTGAVKDNIDRYNRGDVKVILISKAGGQGLDLKGTRNLVILEPYWNMSSIEQAIGRGVRKGSHQHLPPSERYVNIYLLRMLKNQDFRFGLQDYKNFYNNFGNVDDRRYKPSVDASMYGKAYAKQQLINSIYEKVKNISSDCTFSLVKNK